MYRACKDLFARPYPPSDAPTRQQTGEGGCFDARQAKALQAMKYQSPRIGTEASYGACIVPAS